MPVRDSPPIICDRGSILSSWHVRQCSDLLVKASDQRHPDTTVPVLAGSERPGPPSSGSRIEQVIIRHFFPVSSPTSPPRMSSHGTSGGGGESDSAAAAAASASLGKPVPNSKSDSKGSSMPQQGGSTTLPGAAVDAPQQQSVGAALAEVPAAEPHSASAGAGQKTASSQAGAPTESSAGADGQGTVQVKGPRILCGMQADLGLSTFAPGRPVRVL